MKLQHKFPFKESSKKKRKCSSDAETSVTEVPKRKCKSRRDNEEEISAVDVSKDILLKELGSDELPDLVVQNSTKSSLSISSLNDIDFHGPFSVSTPQRNTKLLMSPELSPIEHSKKFCTDFVKSQYMYSNLQMSSMEPVAPVKKNVNKSKMKMDVTKSDVKSYSLRSKNGSSPKKAVAIPGEFDPKLVEQCKPHNLQKGQTPVVKLEPNIDIVENVDEVKEVDEPFVRGRSIVNPKQKMVLSKKFMYKDPSVKKRPQVVGTLKVIDVESNESEPAQKLCKVEGNVGSTKKVTVKKEVESATAKPSKVEIVVTPKPVKKELPSRY